MRAPPVIIVIGEMLVDLVGSTDGVFWARPGGSPANVAVALARLGAPVTLCARVSGDPFGRMLRAHLAANGVRDDGLVRAVERTTLAVATLDDQGRAAYSFYMRGTADWQWQPDELPRELDDVGVALHVGSLSLALSPGAEVIEAFVRRERERGRLTISYDPNIRPSLAGARSAEVARVERQVALADVVRASAEDVGWLYPDASAATIAQKWLALGPQLVIVTLGSEGVYGVCAGGTEVRRPARTTTVIDTIGAGDAFTAGLLDAMHWRGLLGGDTRAMLGRLDADRLGELLDHAQLVASLTCERIGADPPSTAEVASAMERYGLEWMRTIG